MRPQQFLETVSRPAPHVEAERPGHFRHLDKGLNLKKGLSTAECDSIEQMVFQHHLLENRRISLHAAIHSPRTWVVTAWARSPASLKEYRQTNPLAIHKAVCNKPKYAHFHIDSPLFFRKRREPVRITDPLHCHFSLAASRSQTFLPVSTSQYATI